MADLLYFVLLLSLVGYSSGTYCLCKDGLSDSVLQKAIDYACGAGADCTPILQNGACYNPNTVKDHCNYAVNSYFQRKGQAQGTCDFAGAASPSQSAPQQASSACVYPSSASTSTTPSTTTPSTTTPSTTTPSTTTPSTTTPSTTTPTGTSTTPSTTTPSTTSTTPIFNTPTGLAPTGSGTTFGDSSNGEALHKSNNLLNSIAIPIWLSSLLMLWG